MVNSLFDILALLYIIRSVQLSITIWRDWSNIRAEPLTAQKKALAEQAAFFIAVPVSVFVHEAAHALAVWLCGGRVVEFQYRVFWGYVVPQGSFSPQQMWFIAIAGTLGSLLFGLLVWLLARNSPSSSIRYFGLRAFRFQVFFSLVYYPLFTLFGFDGDWRTIYDFGATPLLSALTAVTHVGLLVLFWRGDRLGWFEAPSHRSIAEQSQFDALQAQALADQDNAALQLRYIDALRRGGADRAARHKLDVLLQMNPQLAIAHLEKAALLSAGSAQVTRAASESAATAVALGLDTIQQEAYAYELIGRYEFTADHVDKAVDNYSAAIDALQTSVAGRAEASQLHHLLIQRNAAFRRLQQYDLAFHDLQIALDYARRAGSGASVQQVQAELDVLNSHSNRSFALPMAVLPGPDG